MTSRIYKNTIAKSNAWRKMSAIVTSRCLHWPSIYDCAKRHFVLARMRKLRHVCRRKVDRPYAQIAAGRISTPMLPNGCDFNWLRLDSSGTPLMDSTQVGFVPSQKLCHAIKQEVDSGRGKLHHAKREVYLGRGKLHHAS